MVEVIGLRVRILCAQLKIDEALLLPSSVYWYFNRH